MIDFTEEQIKEAFEKSTPIIKEILLDSWITNDMSLIGKSLKIRIDKVDILIRIVGYIALNLIPLSRMTSVIEEETGLEKEKSIEVARKIDEIIFTKIREKIKESTLKKEENYSVEISPKGNSKEESLITDMENHADRFSGKREEKESFSDMLTENKSTEKVKKVIDPYREMT